MMPLESKRRHIHDPVLLSLKMEGIRLIFFWGGALLFRIWDQFDIIGVLVRSQGNQLSAIVPTSEGVS
jgi:hypothetical protein